MNFWLREKKKKNQEGKPKKVSITWNVSQLIHETFVVKINIERFEDLKKILSISYFYSFE